MDWAAGAHCLDSTDWGEISAVSGLGRLTTGFSQLETKKYLPCPNVAKLHTKNKVLLTSYKWRGVGSSG